ncbi:DUF1269 domain-containing protein [Granulosicoccus antarcticus]|uniref:DUF1269 domain-containing protein n=1 Tax=Granulosicoccus antarcticus IMCC3135 TaxID=1192854 RepID=A0A2Z2NLP7_9GAMM|nr:DUF1269 domain-containing protein [Granulosicoccus antarcticus]ASJ72256.1 hypothetical protein IMCC3135_10820 [Granulosicoccus antarcticus IMCC3135]
MSDLIAIVLESKDKAREARAAFVAMQREHLVETEDSVVVYRDAKGHIKLDQSVNLTRTGAASGGFWGLFIGIIFTIPFGGFLVPLLASVFGASMGALSGKLSDYGIEDEMMVELSSGLDDNKAVLFVLLRKATMDKVLEHLQPFNGKVLKTSLTHELEDKLQQVLDKSHAATATAEA